MKEIEEENEKTKRGMEREKKRRKTKQVKE